MGLLASVPSGRITLYEGGGATLPGARSLFFSKFSSQAWPITNNDGILFLWNLRASRTFLHVDQLKLKSLKNLLIWPA